ncbi:unnamed protein product [Ilex paraguariensis]|uniref:tRNA(Ile)-lysidine synthetase n=1 Tax=Ilex paraguariensis TaxID=185542 RepID=A0ABC8TS71_9AQUA
MARGLLVSSQSKTTSQLILTSISRVSLSTLTKGLENPFASTHLRCSPSTRFLCCCSNYQQHDPIDMSTYREAFAKRMAMAGLKPHHRIAIGVSGGPDSMALCVLAAGWKSDGLNAASHMSSGFIGGLLAIVVDHGFRAESKHEASIVCRRVMDMGIKCEIAHCEWSNGKPNQGHLQEAARDKRYQILQDVCVQHLIGVLLIAHHADDQAELFILRLSRGSGVLGLAGMAFTSQLFTKCSDFDGEASSRHGILLVRPLLEYSKGDMYKICQGGDQEWVEDPTNQSALFARNRIRMSLKNLSSAIFNSELQAVISACRRTRLHVDQICRNLLNKAVTVMPQGYAVVDLEILNPSKVEDLCLSKFVSLVLQFISQRHKPVRGSALKLLLDYIRTSLCKTSFTAAGCFLCPSPGSKGSRLLVCCSVDSSLPSKMEIFHKHSYEGQNCSIPSEVEQIAAEGKSYADRLIPDPSDVHFLDVTSSEYVLVEAKRRNILSGPTYRNIILLQRDESRHFKSKIEVMSDYKAKNVIESASAVVSKGLHPGKFGYFMDRFMVSWKLGKKNYCDALSADEVDCDLGLKVECQQDCCGSCVVGCDVVAEVRHMIDADWLYLAELSKCQHVESKRQGVLLSSKPGQATGKISSCSNYVKLSAQKALLSLKTIPVAARRGLPVLVDPHALLLSIPSIGFKHCPCLMASAVFKPRIPLGGGHSSFI